MNIKNNRRNNRKSSAVNHYANTEYGLAPVPDLNAVRSRSRTRRVLAMMLCMALTAAVMTVPAFATSGGGTTTGGDALTAVNNLSTFIFSLIRAVGIILLGYGILQVGLSFQSHDPSQRSNGILTIAGGIIIVFTKEILDLITA